MKLKLKKRSVLAKGVSVKKAQKKINKKGQEKVKPPLEVGLFKSIEEDSAYKWNKILARIHFVSEVVLTCMTIFHIYMVWNNSLDH